MAQTPRELDVCVRPNAEFVRTVAWGYRNAPKHSGKLTEVAKKAVAKLVGDLPPFKEAEDDTRERNKPAGTCHKLHIQQNGGGGLSQRNWHSPAPEKQFIKQKPPLTQSVHLTALPLSSSPYLPLSPLFSATRVNSKKVDE
ncbi:hypothetical protein PBY51_005963 [Eleginops maclovinus]|uniref:Uncharacterized protein n=1 Tax=Eleginops maclovinus TaxID=56733 RepID=A0AAN8AA21_ELEMC|nr:hypothetical protein PBY51_005963 [Eleginops maclovinus]